MRCTTIFVVALTYVAVVYATQSHLTGKIGNQDIPIHIQLAEHEMVATIHKPDNAPADFRETTNLHIFQTHIVAMRNSEDKQCYIRYFGDTHDQIKGRIMNAEYNNGRIGNVTEDRINLEGVPPLTSRTVNLLLGPKIAHFCYPYDVYGIDTTDVKKVDFKDMGFNPKHQIPRSRNEFTVVGICCRLPPPGDSVETALA